METGSLAPSQAVDYAIQIARGLAAAHERNIVHRDLKPENVPASSASSKRRLCSLGEGRPRRRAARPGPGDVDPAGLVAYFAKYWDLVWVLDDARRSLLLRLTPSAFDDDRALKGDLPNARSYGELARKAVEEQLVAEPANREIRTGS